MNDTLEKLRRIIKKQARLLSSRREEVQTLQTKLADRRKQVKELLQENGQLQNILHTNKVKIEHLEKELYENSGAN